MKAGCTQVTPTWVPYSARSASAYAVTPRLDTP